MTYDTAMLCSVCQQACQQSSGQGCIVRVDGKQDLTKFTATVYAQVHTHTHTHTNCAASVWQLVVSIELRAQFAGFCVKFVIEAIRAREGQHFINRAE